MEHETVEEYVAALKRGDLTCEYVDDYGIFCNEVATKIVPMAFNTLGTPTVLCADHVDAWLTQYNGEER